MDSCGFIVFFSCLALGSGLGMTNNDHGGFRVQENMGVGKYVDKNGTLLIDQLNDKPTPGHFIEDTKNKVVVAVLVSLGIVIVLMAVLLVFICKRKERVCFAQKTRAPDNDPEALDEMELETVKSLL